jgi:hypothetical protein
MASSSKMSGPGMRYEQRGLGEMTNGGNALLG